MFDKKKNFDIIYKNSNRLTKKDKIKILTKEFFSQTSTHGLSNYCKAEHIFIKLLWFICFIISCAGCGFFIIKTLADFTSYEVITNIDVYYEQESQFPTISICSRDSYNFSNLSEITYCSFSFDENCSVSPHSYFELFYDSHYGLCYRFNSGKDTYGKKIEILNTTYGGKQNGFELDIKLNVLNDYSKLVVYVHNHTDVPYGLFNKGIDLNPGTSNFLSVDRVFTRKLDYPYNDCLKDPITFSKNKSLIELILNSNRTYSQKTCFDLCFSLLYKQNSKCNCIAGLEDLLEKCYVNLDRDNELRNCSRSFRSNFVKKYYTKCFDYCPLECDSVTYMVSATSFLFPISGNISDRDKKAWFGKDYQTYEDVLKNYYSLIIFYEDLKYTLISHQEKMSLADLISNFGGIIGVFMGSSFLSLIEFVEIIFYVFLILKS